MIHVKSGTRAVEEAAALRAAAHPGVVELVDATDGVVRTRRVEGRTLGDTRPLTAEEIAGVAGAVATTLADLHDLGIAHGGVDATHVIVADEGRPVLCSLGRGGEPADDVAALGRLVTEMLVRRPPERPAPSGWAQRRKGLGPMLAPPAAPALAALAAEATAADPAHRPSARALAAAIYQHTHSAQLPQAEAIDTARPLPGPKPKGRRWPSHRSLAVPAAVGCAVVVMVSGILVASRGVGPGGASVGKPHGAAGDSRAADGGANAGIGDFTGGVLTVDGARYSVGQAGDAAAIGDWTCSGRPTLVVLRPSSGELFAFDQWPEPGHDVTARPIGRVERATGVRATPPAGGGCYELEVLRSEAPPTRLDVTP